MICSLSSKHNIIQCIKGNYYVEKR
uniref:Uncharacterized protein n=1 Tax=Arundo donax TaxID=35708 RepID=A0A0A9EJJ3_ARUDO